MQIFVRVETGKTITLDMEPTATVDDVKARVQEREGIPKNLQRLCHGGRPLEDDRALSDYNISNASTLFLLPRIRPVGNIGKQADDKKDSPKNQGSSC